MESAKQTIDSSVQRPVKVLLVSPYLYPKIGGVERYVYEFAKQLHADPAYQVNIVTSNTDGNTYKVGALDGITVHYIPARFRLSNTPLGVATYKAMQQVINAVDPDIIHAHAPVPFFAELAAWHAGRRKLVLTYHAGSLKKGSWPIDIILSVYERLVLPRLFLRADAITTVSSTTLTEMFSDPAIAPKASVIPPGVHLPYDGVLAAEMSTTITYVGRIDLSSRWKGLDTLLEAFAIASKKKPELSLQIVGSGDALPLYEDAARNLGIGQSVTFTGSLSGEALAAAFRRSGVVVLPSISSAESFGLVLLEAMTYGVPVIGSRIGGIVNLITDRENGLLVEPGNAEALATAMTTLCTDQVLRAICVAGGLDKAQHYTWEMQTKKITHVYQSLLLAYPKKILHIVPAYPPSLGGMEERVKELVYKLKALNIRLEIITSSMGTTSGDVVEDGIRVRRIKKLSFITTPISFRLLFVLWRAQADIFHIHVAQPFYPIVAAVVAKLRRKPYILHIRAIVESQNFFGKLFIYIYKKVPLLIILRFASKCIIMTDAYRDILINKYGVRPEAIVTIPNATSFVVNDKPRSLPSLGRVVQLLAVGRVDKQKNYHFMLRMLKVLKEQGLFHLTIVGSGAQEVELKAYAHELGVGDMVTWSGRLEGKVLEETYVAADVFIHTAHFESFGTVFIEAMAKGLPICATRVLGAIDVVKEDYNGLLCDFDESAFAQNVHRVVTDANLYTTLSTNNLSTVKQYQWDQIVAATVTLYDDM
ncbi:MAG: hypothetical protein RLZZ360_740 [Candidatus Parcubacteria bacterium]|jgi:glycosyltransferase involved in cell wall biosynthesis